MEYWINHTVNFLACQAHVFLLGFESMEKSQRPQVSILMATWNRAHLIDRTIESVQRQSVTDWELIVADDGSSDSTPEKMAAWQKKEPRIVYTRSDANIGISRNYNRGLRIARGEFVAMIDDDDPWTDENKLKKQIAFLDAHRDYVGVGGGVVVVDANGKELYRYLKPETDEEIRKYTLFSNPMANSTTMFRRATGEEAGWYDESIRYSGDRDFWMKMGLRGKLYNFPEYFSFYTMTGQNTSIAKLRPHLKTSFMVMRRYKKEYPGYPSAFLLNWIQYLYSFIPAGIREFIHRPLARLKRRVVK